LYYPIICAVLNIPIVYNSEIINNPHAASIDRIDITKGYIKNNFQIISYRANIIKSNATLEKNEINL
jgi:microcompartment protein CcmL/EutN